MKNFIKSFIAFLFFAAFVCVLNHYSEATAGGASLSMAVATIISPSRKRAILSKIASIFPDNNFTIQESFLRVDQAIQNGKNNYTFPIIPTPGTDYSAEQKLVKNDVFIVTHLGMFLYKAVSGLRAREVMQTYPNSTYFAAGTNFVAGHLNAFYQGKLNVKVQDKTYIEALDTKRFLLVPPAQQGMVTAVNTAADKLLALSTFNLKDALVEVDPNIYLNGDVQNTLGLEIPLDSTDVPANDNANTTNYVVLYAHGFLVKGGSPYYNDLVKNMR